MFFYFLPPNIPDNACPSFANGFEELEELLAAFVILPAAPPAVALPAARTEPTDAEVAKMTLMAIAKGSPKLNFLSRIID